MHPLTICTLVAAIFSLPAANATPGWVYPDTVPLSKRQEPGTPQYACHEDCGLTITFSRQDGYCDNSEWVSHYETCLTCANTFNIWQYYGSSVSNAARGCGLTPEPSPSGDDESPEETTNAPSPTSESPPERTASGESTMTEPPTETSSGEPATSDSASESASESVSGAGTGSTSAPEKTAAVTNTTLNSPTPSIPAFDGGASSVASFSSLVLSVIVILALAFQT